MKHDPAEDLDKALALLSRIRHDTSLWKAPRGACGQDKYAGMPPFCRMIDTFLIDEAYKKKEEEMLKDLRKKTNDDLRKGFYGLSMADGYHGDDDESDEEDFRDGCPNT